MTLLVLYTILLAAVAFIVANLALEMVCKHIADNLLGCDHAHYDAVVCCSYAFDGVEIPWRGRQVAQKAAMEAHYRKVPLIVPIGHCSPTSRSLRGAYLEFFAEHHASVKIIPGVDDSIRTTEGEVIETIKRLGHIPKARIIVVAAMPHLARVRRWWRKHKPPTMDVRFIGVEVRLIYYPHELAMIVLEWLLPPGTKRRERALDIAGRKTA